MHPYFRVSALTPALFLPYTFTNILHGHMRIPLTTNNVFTHDDDAHVHKERGKKKKKQTTDVHKYTLADTHPYAHTPAARPSQPLVLMDGSLIATLTLGLLSPHLSPRTCERASVCACINVSGSGGVICCQRHAHSHTHTHKLLISRFSSTPTSPTRSTAETHFIQITVKHGAELEPSINITAA